MNILHYHGNCITIPGSHFKCTHEFTSQIARVRGSKSVLFILFLCVLLLHCGRYKPRQSKTCLLVPARSKQASSRCYSRNGQRWKRKRDTPLPHFLWLHYSQWTKQTRLLFHWCLWDNHPIKQTGSDHFFSMVNGLSELFSFIHHLWNVLNRTNAVPSSVSWFFHGKHIFLKVILFSRQSSSITVGYTVFVPALAGRITTLPDFVSSTAMFPRSSFGCSLLHKNYRQEEHGD
jgi:hypothetical protein